MDELDQDLCGVCNMHFEVKWDDGSCWLLRVRLNEIQILPPVDFRASILESEYITVKTLKGAGLPVADAWWPDRTVGNVSGMSAAL
jgi:hypothetical protein